MLNGAQLPTKLHHGLWTEAAMTATDIENVLVANGEKKKESPYQKFYKRNPTSIKYLQPFGELAVVLDHKKKKI